ncbi:MAG: SOS response-associated peptidase family protein [Myxococcota bacterium]
MGTRARLGEGPVDRKDALQCALRDRRDEALASTRPSASGCLVAADGFYEWTPRDRGHRPHHFTAAKRWSAPGCRALRDLAWPQWRGHRPVCTILTTEAGRDLAPVHPRMPVILWRPRTTTSGSHRVRARAWLRRADRAGVGGQLHRVEVGRHVNSPRHDDPLCLEPVGVDTPGPLFGAADGAR